MKTQSWSENQTARIGREVRRLRDARGWSAQRLADRTRELGYQVTRTVISDVEIGRRQQLSVAEMTVLARALDTSPAALMYPAPEGIVEVLPGVEVSEIRAAQWFSGLLDGSSAEVHSLFDDPVVYGRNLKRLRLARKIWDLEENKVSMMAARAAEPKGGRGPWTEMITGIQREIAEATRELRSEYDDAQR
ncbi:MULTISPECIES: helix-turn-helix domain-containing protein [Mycolicibacterium]|nr:MULTISPECIES: helix-turn-helix transcriptional regulator [Mycolicibacterium]MCW1820793.1 helix-turn-helix domain-containing protein [Mycolicibacterium senegalense]